MISEQLRIVRSTIADICASNGIGQPVRLVAVTKNQPPTALAALRELGVEDVAENRVQALAERYELLPGRRHLIGHLQTNKARLAVRLADMIQSVDSPHLAQELARCCVLENKTQDILLQVNIAREETKFGVFLEHLPQLLDCVGQLPQLRVRGIMAIMPLETKGEYYQKMYDLYQNLSATCTWPNVSMDFLSMGMSGDYPLALRAGANMIRIGRFLFQ